MLILTSKATFNAASYATFRPSYPPKLFQTVLSYHRGPKNFLLDLGCGHGLIAREFAPSFTRILATDPSPVMIAQAKSTSTSAAHSNISFAVGTAEDLSAVADGSLDMIVSGQAAHWFNYEAAWPEIARKVRKGGTLAFWGYKDNYFVDYPKATEVLDHYCYGDSTMGPYWEQPGRSILRDLYRDIKPPAGEWEDVERIEYEPGTKGKGSGEGTLLMEKRLKLGEMEGYARTFSSYHNWKAKHGDEKDMVDIMFEKMLEAEPEWKKQGEAWRDFEVENEWGSVILLARKK